MAALLAGCTLVTEAGDRELIDRLDFDYRFLDMRPHADDQLDVALVTVMDGARTLVARARMVMPTGVLPSQPYPPERLEMERVVDDQKYELLFYVDNDLDNNPAPEQAGMRPEHIWVRSLAENGEGSFTHLFVFQDFKEDYVKGADFVLDVPSITAGSAREGCLKGLFAARGEDLTVRVVLDPNGDLRQVGHFSTHRGNSLPRRPVRLEGIADVNNQYGVEVLVDGVRAKEPFPVQASAQGATVAFRDWFPAAATDVDRCLALP